MIIYLLTYLLANDSRVRSITLNAWYNLFLIRFKTSFNNPTNLKDHYSEIILLLDK